MQLDKKTTIEFPHYMIVKHNQTSSNITNNHQTSPIIIKHQQTSTNIIKHQQTSTASLIPSVHQYIDPFSWIFIQPLSLRLPYSMGLSYTM